MLLVETWKLPVSLVFRLTAIVPWLTPLLPFGWIGGIMLGSRIGSSQINAGAGYLMPSVAAAYIGFSVGGSGRPNAFGTFAGAVLVGILENGLVMMSVPYYSLNIFKGAVLVLALA